MFHLPVYTAEVTLLRIQFCLLNMSCTTAVGTDPQASFYSSMGFWLQDSMMSTLARGRKLSAGCRTPDNPEFCSSHLEFELSLGLPGTIQLLSPLCLCSTFDEPQYRPIYHSFSTNNLHPRLLLAHVTPLRKWEKNTPLPVHESERDGITPAMYFY